MRKKFPTNQELDASTLKAINSAIGEITPSEIKAYVIKELKLSQEIVDLEDESGIGTKLDYQLRWSRTRLKNKNLITNVKRGVWKANGEF